MKQKILHSIQLLQKAEKIALSYDPDHGYYLATEGGLGYMCDRGNTTSNGVRYITGGTDRQQMRRHCTLLCQDILRKAKNMGISITISNNKLLTI